MHADDLVVNDGRTGQTIEGVAELLPHLDRIATTAFVVKAVNAINAGAFVVASEQEKVFRVLDLVGKQQRDHLERLLAAVDVVAEEEVVGLIRVRAVAGKAKAK